MASDFLRLVIRSAPRGAAIDLHDLPGVLRCVAEESVSEGRTDLGFTDAADKWHAIVEIKIHAGYGHEQIERYLRSFRTDAERNVLAAITRDVPTYGDYEGDDPNWAGSVRWAKLLPGLRTLRPQDPALGDQWPMFLDVLEREGSMGFTKPQTDLFQAWSRYPDARQHMVDFVDAVRTPLLDALRDVLVTSSVGESQQGVAFATRGRSEVAVVMHLGKIFVRFCVPAGGPERVRAGLWGWGDPRFFVEVPYPKEGESADAIKAAIASLKRGGFSSWRNQSLGRYLPLDDALLGTSGLEERVVEFGRESFALIVASGILGLDPVEIEEPSEEPSAREDPAPR